MYALTHLLLRQEQQTYIEMFYLAVNDLMIAGRPCIQNSVALSNYMVLKQVETKYIHGQHNCTIFLELTYINCVSISWVRSADIFGDASRKLSVGSVHIEMWHRWCLELNKSSYILFLEILPMFFFFHRQKKY